ncbi:MAG: hypothetical protein HFJ09_04845 [Lachnospiraceae bacterium]|nr:hypothetical protein [Lachnospiraceae bacterium]
MNKRLKTENTKSRVKSIFVYIGMLFFFCLFGSERIPLLFTHKLDTCCQAMCRERKTAKNPAFRRMRILNRLDSVTVCTVGVNSNRISANASEDWKYKIYQSEGVEYADLTEYIDKERVQITIPQYVQDKEGNTYPVGKLTSIVGEKKTSEIKRIYIPKEIGQITLGKESLAFFETLEEVDIACNVIVEERVFYGCKNLGKIQCQMGLSVYGASIDTFAGCGNLADIIVSSGKIQVEGGVFDSIPRDCNLILEDTVELEVKEDFSRGNVNLVCYKNVSAKENIDLVVKNGYFYYTDAVAEHLTILPKEKLYAITTSPIFIKNREISTDIVAGIEVGNVRNTAFFVAKDKERKMKAQDLKIVTDEKEDAIKVVCYAPWGRINRYIEQWQDSKEVTNYNKGAVLLCDPLRAGEVQSPVIAYSGKKYILGEIQGHNALPTHLDIQLAENAHLVEGMKEDLISGQLLVTVLFDNGKYKEILSKEDYNLTLEGRGYLKQGQENSLLITVKKDYEITGRLSMVKAAKKQLVSGSAVYIGSTAQGAGTALEGTKPDIDKFSILATFDNGETLYLENPSITILFDEVALGEKLYNILCDGCEMSVKIVGVPNRVQSLSVKYEDDWLPVGEYLDAEKIYFEIIRESGKREKVQNYIINEYQIDKGENTICLSYTGNLPFVPECKKTAEFIILGAEEEEITTEVYLIREDLLIMSDSIIDTSFFGIKQTYQGKPVVIENPEIFILPYKLKEGENVLQVQYNGKNYPVSIWVGKGTPVNTREPNKPTVEPLETPDNSISSTPAPKFIGEISIAGSGKIKFQNSGKISYQIYKKAPVTIAFSTKRIKKIQWQLVEKGKSCKKSAWKTLKGHVWKYHKNITNCVLYIQVIDENGNKKVKKTNGFTIDLKKPTLNIVNKKTYSKGFSIKAADKGSGIKKITLNGKKISNGTKINKSGKYQIRVWDRAGNCTHKLLYVK